jgi:nitroimidazol reductase NimA-like FMN-containing flavoprotein (pyridoxamine 5'-phosphate oxidase superfamily)
MKKGLTVLLLMMFTLSGCSIPVALNDQTEKNISSDNQPDTRFHYANLLTQEEAMKLLGSGEYGILSTIGEGNLPYGVPVSYALVENSIYFHCANEGAKLDNIKGNSKVCFTVVGKTNVLAEKFSTEYESVIVFGNAAIVEGDEKVLGLKEIIKKYSPDFIPEGDEYINRAKNETTVVRISIEGFTGKHRK